MAALLGTVPFAYEVVVADAESADDTAAVARAAGAKVLRVVNNFNLNVNKSAAIAACTGEWVLYLDPDERVPEDLGQAIQEAVASGAPFDAYEFPRRNNYFGKYLRFGGAYPDYQRRLFRRGKAHFPCVSVHEKIAVNGPVGRLGPALIHVSYPNVNSYLKKLPLYVAAGADNLARRGVKPSLAADLYYLLLRPAARFILRFFIKLGFLDGWPGFWACLLDAVQSALSYYELRCRRP